MVAMNLSLAFAEDNRGKVLLVDGDLRRPALNRFVRPAAKFGLSEILNGTTTAKYCVLELESPPLCILPAGETLSDPVELLASRQAEELFQELKTEYQTVIIDSPPIIPFTDADVLARYSEGVLMVVRSGKTTQSMLKRAVEHIRTKEIIGTVLNDQPFNLADRSHYYDKYYHKYYETDRKS